MSLEFQMLFSLLTNTSKKLKKHGQQAKALQRVITKIGNATLMTNITTASGFATFVFVDSKLLREFGILASVNIISIFVLALLIVPVLYSFMPLPKKKHLSHLETKWIENVVNWMEKMVKHRRITVYIATVIIIITSIIGVYKIRVSGSLIEDMPKSMEFYKDIKFFEKEFGGIMPLEILIDTKKDKGVMKLSVLKKMDKINEAIASFPELSKPISVVNLVKYSKQAYYKGNPKYYQLPTGQEQGYIFAYTKNSNSDASMLKTFVDSTGRYARITTFMKDIGTDKMDIIQKRLKTVIDKEFPFRKIFRFPYRKSIGLYKRDELLNYQFSHLTLIGNITNCIIHGLDVSISTNDFNFINSKHITIVNHCRINGVF